LARGTLAVDLFFLLSGFVIAYAYLGKLDDHEITPLQFMKIRIIRLYPVYFISIILALSCSIISLSAGKDAHALCKQTVFVAILTAFFIPSRTPGEIFLFSINKPYWSLFYEIIINGVFSFSNKFFKKSIYLYIAFLVTGLLFARMAMKYQTSNIGMAIIRASVIGGICRSFFGICYGVILYRYRSRLLPIIARWISPWTALCFVTLVLFSPSINHFDGFIDFIAIVLIFPISILAMSKVYQSRADKVLFALGSISYPLYLLHYPFVKLLNNTGASWISSHAPWTGILFVILTSFISYWVEKAYDIPIRKYLSSRFNQLGYKK